MMVESAGSMCDECQGWERASREHLPSRLRDGPGAGWGEVVLRVAKGLRRGY